MNKNWQFFGLLIALVLFAACILFMSQNIYSDQLDARSRRSNPVSIYIKREIKTDLYTPSNGPAPLSGWEMSEAGVSNGEGMQTKTSASSGERKPASANGLQSGNRGQDLDSLTSVNHDSTASR